MEGKKTADELAKDGAEVGGGAIAAATAFTIKQLRKEICATGEFAVHFHVQGEERKDRDEIVPKRETWQCAGKTRGGRTHDARTWTEKTSV